MGGAAAGEVASQTSVMTVTEMLCKPEAADDPRRALESGITEANRRVFSRGEREPSSHGMGTTLVSLLVREGCVWIAHVGDSRCYRFRAGKLERMTQDHSLVDEQVRLGQMTPAEAEMSPLRNVITRAIGTRETVSPDMDEVAAEHGDLFLLCSDGLTKEVSEPRLAELLSGDASDLQALCQRWWMRRMPRAAATILLRLWCGFRNAASMFFPVGFIFNPGYAQNGSPIS